MDVPRTTSSFLGGLAEEQTQAWAEFYERYGPMVRNVARRSGLDDADQNDVVQETFIAFLPALRDGKYDRQLGRLRHYLGGIAVNKVRNIVRSPHRRRREAMNDTDGGCDLDAVPDDSRIADLFEDEWRRGMLRESHQRLKAEIGDRAFQAYILYAVEERPADEVADMLGIERATVYVHKNRALASLRKIMADLDEVF